MTPSQPDLLIPVQAQTDVAAARRAAAHVASRAGFAESDAGSIAVITTEAATNLLKHGSGGDLIVRNVSSLAAPRLEILALDRGKGMNNVARCFEDGYSTAGSPGTGLGAIARASQLVDMYSLPGKGTVLLSIPGVPSAPAVSRAVSGIEVGAISAAYPGEEVSGDAWAYSSRERRTRIMVADGLGHGILASEAAHAALPAIEEARNSQPADVLEDANGRLKSTRGAAIAVADIDFAAGQVFFSGVGNIVAAVVSPSGGKRQMVSMNGTVGHAPLKARQFQYPFERRSLLLLHSDGLSANWSFDKYPGLLAKHPSVVAAVLFRDFRRSRDDATIIVIRESKP